MNTTLKANQTMSWERFKQYFYHNEKLGLSLDISRIQFPDNYFETMEPKIQKAYSFMDQIEGGAIANPDEKRMVGHYWLRNSKLAPNSEITKQIDQCLKQIGDLSGKVHSGKIKGSKGNFKNLLVVGIGGSALGPQFVDQALGSPKKDKLQAYYFDNTDPNGIDTVLEELDGQLGQTLCVVISKSGGTPETRNGMLEAKHAYEKAGLDFGKHTIAITGENSKLDKYAKENGWIDRLPLWDWVGGRTSELAAVGLLPAALQGIDINQMLEGARAMDEATRSKNTHENPAALLALMWYYATQGKGEKDMVILPYRDRLCLFSKYLQQLIMESLGKERDLNGKVVHQGIAVYGNKGSTDQHAYVQQLREGVNNFFVTFIEVLQDRNGESIEVEEGATSGDFLQSFYLGTRNALSENQRESISITVKETTPYSVGMLIALYERAVGYYATLVNINAYHQPGVEAGKKAASSTLELKQQIHEYFKSNPGKAFTAEEAAKAIGRSDSAELTYKLLEHMAHNEGKKIQRSYKSPAYMTQYKYVK